MIMSKFKIRAIDIQAIVVIILIVSFITGLFLLVGYNENNYTVNTKIVAIEGNTYTVETKNGHQFQFTVEEYEVGDEVKLYMRTNNTDNFYDDEIQKVKVESRDELKMQ
jgi:hypothetical protein